jgi:CBS domain-containing protein
MTMDSANTDAIESIRSGPGAPGSYRLPRLEHARVEDAMRPGVISVTADTPLREVARALSIRHIHCLVVTNLPGDGAPARWGLISSFDLVLATVEGAAGSFEGRTAAELASATPPTVSSAEDLDRAAQLMVKHGAEHLIVVGADDRRPVGVLSTLDIAGVMAWGEA